MAMTASEIRAAFAITPKGISRMFGKMLRDFGYYVTDEQVEAELEVQINQNAEPCNLNYGLWLRTYLRDGVD